MRRQRVHFPDVIADIERHGMPRGAIARKVGVSPSTITRLAYGDRGVSHDLGTELVRLRDSLATPNGPGSPRER